MCHDIGSVIGSYITGRFHLLCRKLHRLDRIAGRHTAAARHQFDMGRTTIKLLTHCPNDLRHAVRQNSPGRMSVLDIAICMRFHGIPMSACLTDVGTAGIDARSRKHLFVKGKLKALTYTSRITECGKSGHQRIPTLGNGQHSSIVNRKFSLHPQTPHMNMGICHSRHCHHPCGVKYLVKIFL